MADDKRYSISKDVGGRRISSESVSKSAGVLEGALWTKGATTFDNDSDLQDFYKPVETYEGFHRYDPDYTWPEEDEKKVVRRIDFKICTWMCLMFFALQLDRGNISQALSDNMLDDLNLTTNEYNTGMTIFYCSFLVAEVPSQLISKRLGPDRWIPIQMVSWSLVASLQAFLSGKSSFYACRSLLGLIEGGFIPDAILYMSYFYTSSELPIRLSYFWTAYQSTSVISAFLAYGILRLRGVNGMEGWRWLFALEGTLTGLIGIISAFYLPPSPTQTKSRFRGKDGWFTEHQEKIMVNRVLRDDPSKGDMHNREGLNPQEIWLCLTDYHMWPIYLMGLSWLIPNHPMTAYLTLQLRSVGFDTFKTNLLTIPASALFIAQALFWTWLSEKINQRFIISLISQVWSLPILIALAVIPSTSGPWVRWVLSTLLVGHPYAHAIIVAVTSRNAGTVRTRTFATAFYNMCIQASSIIATNVYREEDKPLYRTGNRVLIGIAVYNIFLIGGTKFFYVYTNKIRTKKWDAMSGEEKENYLATTTDKGNKRLDFRFAS
ncbi:phthalate transporter [Eremomyces bilateralis CBS 781.70]|uniref:Phthalate transporter n=1 Tax=Eremomyces bilateralis CBS 781.70 TaxID=1392243 RepID=A0A6G1GCL0_9PEZI|nr:phthalate transporter [Eremomyces bilateralis CBS 781.70]KAF1815589.1 phthalate transporter [Eremomyces bilateralis CBS 781.70]